MKKNINNFSSIINVRFKDDSLLRKSLTHKSYDKINNNEILEFLGDRVLGLIISKYLRKINGHLLMLQGNRLKRQLLI